MKKRSRVIIWPIYPSEAGASIASEEEPWLALIKGERGIERV